MNIKSEKGFTIEDLAIAIIVIMVFVGIITTMMYTTYKLNIETDLTSQMASYAVQILEDIDKISYEEVTTDLANTYNEKFSIPKSFKIDIQVSNYGEGEPNVQDVIKIVDFKISYTLQGKEEQFTVKRLKIKEM